MPMPASDKTKEVLTALIQKQMLILGPNVAIGLARKVNGLAVADDGSVTSIKGDPSSVSQEVVTEYINLTGDVTKTLFETLLKNIS